MLVRILGDGTIGPKRISLELFSDSVEFTSELLDVLCPFQIACGDPTRAGENVGEDHDPTLAKDFIGPGHRRRVGGLDDDSSSDVPGIVLRQKISKGGRDRNIGVPCQYFDAVEACAAG